MLFVFATKDNHEFHTNFNKFISIHLKRSGASMFAGCVSALMLLMLLNKKDLSIQAAGSAKSCSAEEHMGEQKLNLYRIYIGLVTREQKTFC